jgi:hypothetical protein
MRRGRARSDMATAEKKVCQQCRVQFTIEPDDFLFYERIGVPAPTWCPECRRQRRFIFRNEWTLYKRTCGLCKKGIISMYPDSAVFPVYCHACWFSDGWDAIEYGRDYDFSRPFFEQMQELLNVVPRLGIFHRNSVNCEYTNMVAESKNVYLSSSVVDDSESVFYSKFIDRSRNIVDSLSVRNSDRCYECRNVDRSYGVAYGVLSRDCIDCRFVFDCVNCRDCVLSSNLRNRQYVIRNVQRTKEEYAEECKQLGFGKRSLENGYRAEFAGRIGKALHKYADMTKTVNSTGDHMANTKNAIQCFETHDVEDARYCYRFLNARQLYDCDYGGLNSERMYEYCTAGKNDARVLFSFAALDSVSDALYMDYCSSSSNCFGCAGLKSKSYCILNKQYTKEEYAALVPNVIAHMDAMPYRDSRGVTYAFGEFFPPELSPFAYNESLAQEFFPLSETEARERGWRWAPPESRNYPVTIDINSIPDYVGDVPDSIVGESFACAHSGSCQCRCTKAFKITAEELRILKTLHVPLPILCPGCRYAARMSSQNPLRLWRRTCMCEKTTHQHGATPCTQEFKTSYAPDRKEIVYCEQCYNAEVA